LYSTLNFIAPHKPPPPSPKKKKNKQTHCNKQVLNWIL
jgi:hypothetical protein